MSIDRTAIADQDQDQGLFSRMSRFFYDEEVPYGLAIVRILMPLVLLVAMGPRWQFAREIYSTDGAPSPLWFNYGRPGLLPLFPGGVIVAMHTLLIFFLVASSLGWKTRFSLWCATILYVYINLCDSVSTITKYSVIASHVMLLLSMSHCGALWSLDAWLKRRKQPGAPGVEPDPPRFAAWPRRLMQLMIGIVYFGAAITKMHTPEFFSGQQMETWLLTNVNYDNPVGEYMSLYPALMGFFAYITIVWEIVFLFVSWRGWARYLMLALGVMFHLMTTLVLGLYIFPMVCISIYFCFVNERDAQRFGVWFARLREKIGRPARTIPATSVPQPARGGFRLPSPVVYAATMLAVMTLGVELEHQMDPYGIRRPEGRHTLREITDLDHVGRMLASPQPLRLKDMFNTFEIGTDFLSGSLLDRRDEFRQGEVVAAQVGLNAPHHDMWLECNLYDARGNQLDRVGQVVARENLKANFYYTLDEVLEPGEYYFVLKSGGNEIMQRRIVLHPKVKPPVAN